MELQTAEPAEPIFLVIKLKKKIVIIKMSTSGLVLKNNRERKERRRQTKKIAYNKGYFLPVTHPCSNPAGLGLTSAIGRRARFPCGITRRQKNRPSDRVRRCGTAQFGRTRTITQNTEKFAENFN